MATAFTVKTRVDILNVVPKVLGFNPEASLVILSLAPNSPQVRVDLDVTPAELALGLAEALHYFTNGVAVVAYGSPEAAVGTMENLETILPGVMIVDAFTYNDGVIYHHDGAIDRVVCSDELVDVRADIPVAASRSVLVEQANEAPTRMEAILRAIKAYMDGNGALAWCYLDRADALAQTEEPSEQATTIGNALKACLSSAVHPKASPFARMAA